MDSGFVDATTTGTLPDAEMSAADGAAAGGESIAAHSLFVRAVSASTGLDPEAGQRVPSEYLVDEVRVANHEIPLDMVLVDIPSVYTAADERGCDRVVMNRRAVTYNELLSAAQILKGVVQGPSEQMNLSRKLLKMIIETMPSAIEPGTAIMSLIDQVIVMIGRLASTTDYQDLTNCGLNFDRIVNCTVDEDKVLVAATPVEYRRGVYFYSQLSDAEQVQAREQMNDTDLNRAYRIIQYAVNMLTFQPGYLGSSFNMIINLVLTLHNLTARSIMIEGRGRCDLRVGFLALAFDMILRSRIVSAWLNTPSARPLMMDIAMTHKADYGVHEPNAVARFQTYVRLTKLIQFKDSPDTVRKYFDKIITLIEGIGIVKYLADLKKSAITFDGRLFYCMDAKTFNLILSMLPANMFTTTSWVSSELFEEINGSLLTIGSDVSDVRHTDDGAGAGADFDNTGVNPGIAGWDEPMDL